MIDTDTDTIEPTTTEPPEDSAAPPVPIVEPTDVTFVVDGPFEGLAISVQRVFVGVLASAPLTSATQVLTLDPRPTAELDTLTINGDSIRMGFYDVTLHVDDGDGLPESGEVYAGGFDLPLLFVAPESWDSPALSLLGVQIGWNAWLGGDLTAVSVPVQEPALDVTIGGSYDATDAPRLAVAPAQWLDDGTFGTLLYDEPIASAWSITLDVLPPADHQLLGDPLLPDTTAIEVPFIYTDSDASGSYTKGDVRLDELSLCEKGEAALGLRLGWFPRSDDFFHNLLVTQAKSGWHLVSVDKDGDLDVADELADDVVVGPCPP